MKNHLKKATYCIAVLLLAWNHLQSQDYISSIELKLNSVDSARNVKEITELTSKGKKSTQSYLDYCNYLDMSIYAQDISKTFLGKISQNKYDQNSIINQYGSYGSKYSSTSIRNQYSIYGSPFSNYSSYNQYTNSPPMIYSWDNVSQSYSPVAYLTKNSFLSPAVDPDILLSVLEDGSCYPQPLLGYADLTILDIYIEESIFNLGDSITLHFTIYNNSPYNIPYTFYTEVWQDLNMIQNYYTLGLIAYGYTNGILKLKITNPYHLIGVYTDVLNNVYESIEYNNTGYFPAIASTPNLIINDLLLGEVNDSIKIKSKIKNNGLLGINDTITICYGINNLTYYSKENLNLTAIDSFYFETSLNIESDTNLVWLIADFYNNIKELFEFDNIGYNYIIVNINDPPSFVSSPITLATEGNEYIYNITATDNDGDPLIITVPIKPGWLTLTDYGNGTAILKGEPTSNIDNFVSISVTDGIDTVKQEFIITLFCINDIPIFTTIPIINAIVDSFYVYNINATYVDGSNIIISVDSIPDWLDFNINYPNGGTLSGIPSISDTGTCEISIKAERESNICPSFSNQIFNLCVKELSTDMIETSIVKNIYKIYPNPFNDVLVLSSNSNSSFPILIEFYNTTGQLIVKKSVTDQNNIIELDLEYLIPNLYFIKIIDQDKVHTIKIIKQ